MSAHWDEGVEARPGKDMLFGESLLSAQFCHFRVPIRR